MVFRMNYAKHLVELRVTTLKAQGSSRTSSCAAMAADAPVPGETWLDCRWIPYKSLCRALRDGGKEPSALKEGGLLPKQITSIRDHVSRESITSLAYPFIVPEYS